MFTNLDIERIVVAKQDEAHTKRREQSTKNNDTKPKSS
jgi:hypothetical protein